MPEDQFYNLGMDPKKLNDMERMDKMRYPHASGVNPENFPPLKDMKLGDTGEALIQFKVKGDGIEVHGIKWVGAVDAKNDADKEKLLKRHKENQFKQASEPTYADEVS